MRVILSILIGFIVLLLLGLYDKCINNKIKHTNNKNNLLEYSYNSIYLISKYILGCNLIYNNLNDFELKNKILLICNHPTTLDFIYLLHWAKQKNRIKDLRFIGKEAIGNIPIFGDYIKKTQCLISRNYEKDYNNIIEFCKSLNLEETYILVIFPEGTTMYPESKIKSHTFSSNNLKPIFNNVLYPRHRGLELIVKHLVIEQLLDGTLYYNDDKKCYKCNYDKDFLFDSYPKNGVILMKELNINHVKVNNLEKILEKTWKTKDVFIRKLLEVDNTSFISL